ncbi:hypothetical protein [Streptomyces sp. NPDC058964]|uniref:hypothetical protein n=1 Tax=Streptomyces sp. NPDC058964 TaxID=3346681 RepID=UPI003681C349
MTTADHRPGGARGAAFRWIRAALLALVAALAVLVHHETAAALTHLPPARAMAGMHHTATPATPADTSGHSGPAMPHGGTTPTAVHDDDGACSGAMQHCAVAGIDSMKLAPPHQPSTGCAPAFCSEAAVGQGVPGTTGRAPPDLSALSRFLL